MPWGAEVIVDAKIELGDYSWFRVQSYRDGTTGSVNSGGGGWIAVRVPDSNPSGFVEFIPDADPSSLELDLPTACLGVTTPTEVTFYYDREATTRYASENSRITDTLQPGSGYVSHNLTSQGIPFPPDLIYEELTYGENSTGSALFTSETLFMGGHPMTIGSESCTSADDPVDSGWRYCPETTNRWASLPYRQHQALINYMSGTERDLGDSSGHGNSIIVNASSYQREMVLINAAELTNFISFTGGGVTNPFDDNDSPEDREKKLSETYNAIISQINSNGESIEIIEFGDYMFIDSVDTDDHGFIVVGWATMQKCEDIITGAITPNIRSTNETVRGRIDPSTGNLITAGNYMVPYVTDFSGNTQTNLQSPLPRPFYCSKYLSQGSSRFGSQGRHDWYFITFPSVVSIDINNVYMGDANWLR